MASPSYTYTLANSTTADASQVMQDFNDILNGVTDGTKDLSISALTCAGTATLNGHVNLGNSSADDLTITASLASTLPIKTTNSYDIGSSSLGLRAAYFGANSQTVAVKGSASMSATWSLTLPVSAGTANYIMTTDGSGVSAWTAITNSAWYATDTTAGTLAASASYYRARLRGESGYGSTNTKIRRFNNNDIETGTGVTFDNSATAGASFTVTTAGLYAVSYYDNFSVSAHLGLSLNSAELTTSILDLSTAEARLAAATTSAGGSLGFVSWVGYLATNDVIRAHTDGSAVSSSGRVGFSIARIR